MKCQALVGGCRRRGHQSQLLLELVTVGIPPDFGRLRDLDPRQGVDAPALAPLAVGGHVALFQVVQSVSVTVWELEPVEVLQRASVVLRGHPGDLLEDHVQLLLTGTLLLSLDSILVQIRPHPASHVIHVLQQAFLLPVPVIEERFPDEGILSAVLLWISEALFQLSGENADRTADAAWHVEMLTAYTNIAVR